jgi:hypothetical protein
LFLVPYQAGNDISIPLSGLFERIEILLCGWGYEDFLGGLLTRF